MEKKVVFSGWQLLQNWVNTAQVATAWFGLIGLSFILNKHSMLEMWESCQIPFFHWLNVW